MAKLTVIVVCTKINLNQMWSFYEEATVNKCELYTTKTNKICNKKAKNKYDNKYLLQ